MYKYRHNPTPHNAPRCAEHPYSGGLFVPVQATPDAGKLVCPKCGQVIAWVEKPQEPVSK
jgi:hypothetical protein